MNTMGLSVRAGAGGRGPYRRRFLLLPLPAAQDGLGGRRARSMQILHFPKGRLGIQYIRYYFPKVG